MDSFLLFFFVENLLGLMQLILQSRQSLWIFSYLFMETEEEVGMMVHL